MKTKIKSIIKRICQVLINLSVFVAFAGLWVAITIHLTPELKSNGLLFNACYVIGGLFILVNSFRINWSLIK